MSITSYTNQFCLGLPQVVIWVIDAASRAAARFRTERQRRKQSEGG